MPAERYHPADESTALHASQTRWNGLDLLAASDDIRRPTEWKIHESRHTVIVHLGGCMHRLETELESHGGSRGPALPGECWMIPAGRRYASRAHGDIIDYAVLSLNPAPAASLPGEAGGSFELASGSAIHDAFLHQGVRQLLEAAREGSDLARMFGHNLSRLLRLHLQRAHGDPPNSPPAPKSVAYDAGSARRLRDFIHDRIDDELSIEQLAEITGQTTHRMLVSFRATFGKTPWQYIIGERLRHARRRLLDSRHDITRIALESGFSSHSHLTRVFRQRLGCTPSEFRGTHRQPWVPGWR